MSRTPAGSRWLRALRPVRAPRAHLVCFPSGGGVATAYQELARRMAPDVAVSAVQYPGRQDRFAEPLCTVLTDLAAAVAAELPAEPGLVLFGHSMGATVAYETARRLARAPGLLVVSGRPDPRYAEPGALHRGPDAGLLDDLERLAEHPATVAALRANPDLAELVLPAVRADYTAVETYRHTPGEPLSCPILALVADADPTVTVEQSDGWRHFTTAGFDRVVFPGGHFYLDACPGEVAALLSARITTG